MSSADGANARKRERSEADGVGPGSTARHVLRPRSDVNGAGPARKPSHPTPTPAIASSSLHTPTSHTTPAASMRGRAPPPRSSAASTITTSSRSSSARGGGSGGGPRPRVHDRLSSLREAGGHAMARPQPSTAVGRACGRPQTQSPGPPSSLGHEPPLPFAAEAALETLGARWACKRQALAEEVGQLRRAQERLTRDTEAVRDAVEAALVDHDATKRAVDAAATLAAAAHTARMADARQREAACLERRRRAMDEAEQLQERVSALHTAEQATQEEMVLEGERASELAGALDAARRAVQAAREHLAAGQREEARMQDTAYGLSGEVKEMVVEMGQLEAARRTAEVAAMEVEVTRRELYSVCEELKGSIRVYCRVKGRAPLVAATTVAPSAEASPGAGDGECVGAEAEASGGSHVGSTVASPTRERQSGGGELASSTVSPSCAREAAHCPRDSTASDSTTASRTRGHRGGGLSLRSLASLPPPPRLLSARGSDAGSTVAPSLVPDDAMGAGTGAVEELYAYPDGRRAGDGAVDDDRDEFAVPRSITVHQSRQNATSTGKNRTTETFTFDRVFDHRASQDEVYREVEPLVHSAMDGYRVCVFAYGQTGSGKTYTMEGSMTASERYGIIPRALETILARQDALAKEGWDYTLRCSFVEIYNDVIRDLQQSPQVYESGGSGNGSGPGSSTFHSIKHQGENTSVTNVRLTTLKSMKDFRAVYRTATNHRRTARTQLNERSSRSHCIFTLHIDGVNSTIRQRSAGVLCLVDLAGSERVNDSGVHGQQFKEAVNINKSLLDLGKCIHAMRCGSVVPWRNCKLTYLLQNHLGAKGGKMLMLVNVSDQKSHLPESVNSLRFATRVSETVVGASVKRVTNF